MAFISPKRRERAVDWGPYGRRPLALLSLVGFVDAVDRGILPGVLSLVQDDLGFSDTQAGVLGSVFVLMTFVAVLPAGYVADRFRRTSVVAITLASWGAITAVNATVRNFWQFLVVRSALGIGETVDNPASQSLISDYYPVELRGRAYAFQRVAPTIGTAVGLGVGGAVGAAFGWRAAFLVVGVPGSLLALAIWRMPEPVRGESERSGHAASAAAEPEMLLDTATRAGPRALLHDMRIALSVRSMRAVVVGTAIAQGATAGFAFWMPTFYERHTSLSQATAAGALGTVILLGAAFGALGGGIVNDRMRRKDPGAPMRLAGTTQLVAAVLLSFTFLPGAAVGMILAGHFVGVVLLVAGAPALTAMITEIVPVRIRGIAFSMTGFFGAISAASSPLLVGLLADQFAFTADEAVRGHLGYAFLLVMPLQAVGAFIVLSGRRFVKEDIANGPGLDAEAGTPPS